MKSNSFLKFTIFETTFEGSISYKSGGSILIGKHAFKTDNDVYASYIDSTSFINIDSRYGYGALLLEYTTGIFTIRNVLFDNLKSSQLSWGIYAAWGNDNDRKFEN